MCYHEYAVKEIVESSVDMSYHEYAVKEIVESLLAMFKQEIVPTWACRVSSSNVLPIASKGSYSWLINHEIDKASLKIYASTMIHPYIWLMDSLKRPLFFICIATLISTHAYSQLCKNAKIGMSSKELIKTVGLPDSTNFSGMNEKDSLFTWHYGGQEAILCKDHVHKLIMDPKKEGQLNKQVIEGTMSPEDFEKQLEELNDNTCK